MSIIVYFIIAAEVLFWVFIALGLIVRYVGHKQKLSTIILSSTILVDLFLVIATTYHLYNGGKAEIAHGLASVYISVSIVFGKQMIQWADEKFKQVVLKQTPTPKLEGIQYSKQYLVGYTKHVISFLIAFSLIYLIKMFSTDTISEQNLVVIINVWKIVLVIDLIITISYFIWPKKRNKQVSET